MKIIRDRKFYRKVARIAIPITAQSVISIGINMMDTIMLGRLGETDLSASSLANQFIGLFIIMCFGVGMGASVLTARYWGRRDLRSLRKSTTLMYYFCIAIATVFAAVTILMPEQIMRIYTSDQIVIAKGVQYLRWSVVTYWLTAMTVSTTLILRSINEVKIPLASTTAAFFINIGANYVFIFGKLGMPRMEVAGAALGTLISRIAEFAVICGYFFLRDRKVSFRIRDMLMPCGDMRREYLRISFPVLVSDTILGLGSNVVAVIMGHISTGFVTATAIVSVVMQISSVFLYGVSQASCIEIGHTLGEGRQDLAQEQGETFLLIGLAIGLSASMVIALISGRIIDYYRISDETRVIAEELMRAVGIMVVFQATNGVLTKGVMRGGGDTRFLMVADILFLWVVSIPLGAAAGLIWHLSPFWVYICLQIDQIIKSFWCIGRLASREWITAINPAEPAGIQDGSSLNSMDDGLGF